MVYERKQNLSYTKYSILSSFLFCFSTVYLAYSMEPKSFYGNNPFKEIAFNYGSGSSMFIFIFVDFYEQAASFITKILYYFSEFFHLFGDPNSKVMDEGAIFFKNLFVLCFPFLFSFFIILVALNSLSPPRIFLYSLITNLMISFSEILLTASNEVSDAANISYSMEQVAGYAILNSSLFLVLYFFDIMIFGRYRKDD